MSRKTPDGAWPSSTIDDVIDQLAALEPTGTVALVSVASDPGITGALSVIAYNGGGAPLGGGVLDLPTVPDPGDKTPGRQRVDAATLYGWLVALPLPELAQLVCERYHPIPSRTGASMRADNVEAAIRKQRGMEASNTRGAGTTATIHAVMECAAVARGMRYAQPPAVQTWRKQLGVDASLSKDESRAIASRLFPRLAHRLTAQAHHNRAESLLIGHYAAGRRA